MTYKEALNEIKEIKKRNSWMFDYADNIALYLAQKALEKKIPKKPKDVFDGNFFLFSSCPCCFTRLTIDYSFDVKMKYCSTCGQRLEWWGEKE